MTFNEDLSVDGAVSAKTLDGELTEKALRPIAERFKETGATVDELTDKLANLDMRLSGAEAQLTVVSESYNKAIEVINNLSERLAALEANYDPTIIK